MSLRPHQSIRGQGGLPTCLPVVCTHTSVGCGSSRHHSWQTTEGDNSLRLKTWEPQRSPALVCGQGWTSVFWCYKAVCVKLWYLGPCARSDTLSLTSPSHAFYSLVLKTYFQLKGRSTKGFFKTFSSFENVKVNTVWWCRVHQLNNFKEECFGEAINAEEMEEENSSWQTYNWSYDL